MHGAPTILGLVQVRLFQIAGPETVKVPVQI